MQKVRPTFDDCPCSYCQYEEISEPDTHGEYTGIDAHIARLERALKEAVAAQYHNG